MAFPYASKMAIRSVHVIPPLSVICLSLFFGDCSPFNNKVELSCKLQPTYLLEFGTSFFAAGLKELDEAIKSPISIVIDDL